MGVMVSEQETVIRFGRDGDECEVYTSDSTVMTRLDKLASEANEKAPLWTLKEVHYSQSHELVAKTYVTNKRLISFRSGILTREMTEEQKAAAAERMRSWRDRKREVSEIIIKDYDMLFEYRE